MSIIVKMRKQKAVYWDRSGVDNFGAPAFAVGVEIDCRWEDGLVQAINDKGEQITAKSTVYVDREMKVGDMLWLGELADITDADNPRNNEGAWEIKSFNKLPNLKNTETLLTAYL